VFSEKRLQAVENKGNECRKERKETTKRLQVLENNGEVASDEWREKALWEATPPEVLYRSETKGVAGKWFCKSMKTKGQ